MKDNNSFLSGYNKKDETPKENIDIKEPEKTSQKYEEKSGFVKPQKKEPSFPHGPNKKSKMIIWMAVAVIAVAAVVVILVLLLGGANVEIKDFEDWALSDVQLWANENEVGLQLKEEYSDVFLEGRVISQGTAVGTKIHKGDFVELVVSLGHDLSVRLPLPDLLAMTKDQVEAWADENYMTKVRITVEYSDEVASGNVIRFEINDNTVVDEVRRDTPIYVIVSKGMEDETAIEIIVPDFKTMSISESFVFASDNGLELVIEEKYDDYVPKGAVISQSVKAESKVKKGDEIVLIVSKGKKITVPDFSGYSKERASAVASELGIPVSIRERYSSSSAGRFLSQSLDAGSVLEDGDFLELCYSIGNKIVVSSFVGQTRDSIENWASSLNELDARITIKVTYTQNKLPAGTIIFQDIANQVISRGTTIRITVSKGNIIYVPDFVAAEGQGYDIAITREKALDMCEAIGIVPIFVEETNANRLPGEIWSQSIAAGTEVYEGSTITLKYTPTQETQVPDFSGMTQQEALLAGYDKLLNIIFVQSEDVVAGFEGKIFEQSIIAGTTVAKGSIITVSISAEPAPTPSPSPTTTP